MDGLYSKMLCYGKFNSFRVGTIAMQEITELFQFVFRKFNHNRVFSHLK